MKLRELIEKRSRENSHFMRQRLGLLGWEFTAYAQINNGLWNYKDLDANYRSIKAHGAIDQHTAISFQV